MACHPGFWGDAVCKSDFENYELFCTTINNPYNNDALGFETFFFK